MKVCVVGNGSIGGLHLEIYTSLGSDIEVGVVELDPSRRQQARLSASRVYPNLTHTFVDGYDLYDICLPTYLHHETIGEILSNSNARILCEKPLVTNLAQLSNLRSKYNNLASRINCAMVERFNEPFMLAKEWSKTHKSPYRIKLERYTKRPPSDSWYAQQALGGDLMLDLGIHDIDAAIWWTGAKLQNIQEHVLMNNRESVVMLMSDGTEVSIETGWDLSPSSEISVFNQFALESNTAHFSYDSSTETVNDRGLIKSVAPRTPRAYRLEINAAVNGPSLGISAFPSLNQLTEVMRIIKVMREDM